MKNKTYAVEKFKEFMQWIGLDVSDPELKDTPRRVVDMYAALLSGQEINIRQFFTRVLPTKHHEMITFNKIPFVSICPHHLQMFSGHVYIAYIPDGRIAGFSKFQSAVRALARRPILQETFTSTLADAINETLQPIGVMVVVKAVHMCTVVPGLYDFDCGTTQPPTMKNVTSELRGLFLHDIEGQPWSSIAARNEALILMGLGR